MKRMDDFGDLRDETKNIREKIGFKSKKDWSEATATFTKHNLSILGHPVMEDWELNYMQELAGVATRNGGKVLEVGFGMGISAKLIQTFNIEEHVIIEANRDVYSRLIEFSFAAKHSLKPVYGFWEETTKYIPNGYFDGILFDTYPLSNDQIHMNHFPFFNEANRLLSKNGVLTYYSDEVDSFSKSHLRALKDAGFNKIEHFECSVKPPSDCKYWKYDSLLVPVVYKT